MFNDDKEIKLGTWVQINSPVLVEIIGGSEFDFIVIDLEHGNIDLESLENLIRAAELHNLYPIVRVEENSPSKILKVLDIGARGILVPQITSKTEAEKVVKAAKYPPYGERGSCPCIRSGNHWVQNWNEFSTNENKNISVIILVEGKEGIDNFSEIVKTKHVDAFMIGPFDLSVSLGVPGETNHPKVLEKLDEVYQLAKQNNKTIIGVDFSTKEHDIQKNLIEWKNRGSYLLMTSIDKLLFSQKVQSISNIKKII